MPRMTGGQALVRALKAEGVEVVFGLPGVQIMHAYDAFFDNREVRLITCRHEQSTVFMADGYARSTGRIGAALVVPGVGLYNAGAAMATAYAASSPVLLVCGQIDSSAIGKDMDALHEIRDQLDVMKPVVKWNDLVTRAENIPEAIHEAMRQLKTGRPRPVEIDIPPDVLGTTVDIDIIEPETYPRMEPGAASVKAAVDLLAAAEHPLIWAGGGVNLADGSSELVELAELLGAPVLTTGEGKGAIPENHPLSMGSSAWGWGPGGDIVPQADVILAAGTRLGNMGRGPNIDSTGTQKLINLNIDETEIGKTTPVTVGITADAKVGLKHLVAALRDRPRRGKWDSADLAATKANARELLKSEVPRQLAVAEGIQGAIPEDGFVVSGLTNVGYWSYLTYKTMRPRTYITSSYMGTLGFSYPMALGVKVGNPDKAVVALCGDGGFMYAAAELATAVQYGINVVAVVFNNHHFGASNRDQQTRFGGRVVGTELHNPDFVKLAESFGARGIKAASLDEVPAAIEEAIAGDRPTIVEVETPADLDPPFSLQPPQR
ncbi:MAG: thiamine pyrophosphate-dependent enzyme [Dehalococcoidia bacterium]